MRNLVVRNQKFDTSKLFDNSFSLKTSIDDLLEKFGNPTIYEEEDNCASYEWILKIDSEIVSLGRTISINEDTGKISDIYIQTKDKSISKMVHEKLLTLI